MLLSYEILHEPENLCRILIRNQSHTDFCLGSWRDRGFHARSNVAADHAMNFKRRMCPKPAYRFLLRFRTDVFELVCSLEFFRCETGSQEILHIVARQLHHVSVESWNLHISGARVIAFRNELAQFSNRISCHTAGGS